MRILFNKTLLLAMVLTLLSLAAMAYWQREKFFPPLLKTPISAGDIVPNLAGILEKTGLTISGQPAVLRDTVVASVSGIRVIFGTDREFPSQVRALQLVLGRLTINKLPKEIDLRFSKVVIKY